MRTLIVGSNRDYCYALKEFLESRGLITTVVLDYKEGIDRLFYEKPDLTVLEVTLHELSPALINKINSFRYFEVVDVKRVTTIKEGIKPVLILEEGSQIDTLFDFLKSYLTECMENESESIGEEEEGSLESLPYPALLANLYRNRRTGVLKVNSGIELRIYLLNGTPVFAEGGSVQTAFGRMLLISGRITEADYEKAIDIATERKQRLGEVLIGMGLISPHELNSFLELQVKEKIISGLNCTQGTYSFKSGGDFTDSIVTYQINLPQLLYEGIKRYMDVAPIEEVFFQKEKNPTIELTSDLKGQVNSIGFGPRELRFIQLLKDKDGINDTVRASRLPRDETLKLLYFLYLFGFLRLSGVPSLEVKRLASRKSPGKKGGVEDTGKQGIKARPEDIIISQQPQMDWEGKEGISIDLQSGDEKTDKGIKLEGVGDYIGEQAGVNKGRKGEIEIRLETLREKARREAEREEVKQQPKTDAEKRRKKEALIDEILSLYSNLQGKSHYEILGIKRGASKEEIKASYFSLVKKFHPDVNPDLSKEMREKAGEIFTKITEAYETLSDDKRRSKYDFRDEVEKVKSRVKQVYDAELAYEVGETLLKQRRYQEAERKFREAVNLNPEEATYVGALAWAVFLGKADKDRVLSEVKKQIEKAINMNPRVAENYYYLGYVYKHIDDMNKAEANFLKAMECNPEFIEAKRELRLLQQRKSEGNIKDKKREKKFWSSLFKR